jgi:multidrug efflux system outer membrane protein
MKKTMQTLSVGNLLSAGFLVILLNGCSVGPDYVKPATNAPAAFKESRFEDAQSRTWKTAQPQDMIAKGDWWEIFDDAQLDALEKEAEANNFNLKAAVDRVNEERATSRATQADFFPSLTLEPTATRTRLSPNGTISIFSSAASGGSGSGSATGATIPSSGGSAMTFNDFNVPLDFSYEIDLWGRIRRSFESSRADAAASQADFENVLLTLKSDVALDYFNIRSLDAQRRTARNTVKLRQQSLDLYRRRLQQGMENQLTVSQAETELHDAQQQASSLDQSRAKMEHALAILLGRAPADFSLAEATTSLTPPSVPVALPSEVLERRPDVAEAERKMISANAQIGVAQAAFFPVVRLTGDGGFESVSTRDLFNWQSRIWSLGPSITFPVLDGGQNGANLKKARASYDEALNNYREQVLQAFQDVEDSLSDLHYLSNQIVAEQGAVQSALQSADLSHRQYIDGSVNYLTVVDADRQVLDSQLTLSQLEGQKCVATVQLIKALGGGWQDSSLARE